MKQKTTTIAAALFLLILLTTAQAASVSITANVRSDGRVEITANGTDYASCDENPNEGITQLYIKDTLYCAQHGDGDSSCTTVFDKAMLNGTTTFTATATDCQGTATTTYTMALDNAPTATPTAPSATEQAISVSLNVNVRPDGGVEVTASGTGYSSCYPNPDGGVVRLYIWPALYCAQYAEGGSSSCTVVFDRATKNGTTLFTATATDCMGTATTTYTLVLDNTPTITPTAPGSTVSGTFNFTADAVFQPTLNPTKGYINLYVDGYHVGGVDKACTTLNCTYDYQEIAGHLYELPHGNHTFSFMANGGGVPHMSPTQNLAVDNTPTVAISLPTGTVSSPTNITADAVFKPSLNATKGTITFYMDNVHIAAGDKVCTTENCHYDYEQQLGHPYTLGNGNHTVKLVANGNGKSANDQKNFTVEACNLAISGFTASPTIINANGGQITNLQGTITGNNGHTPAWQIQITGGPSNEGNNTQAQFDWNGMITDIFPTNGTYTATITANTITNCSKTAQTTVEVTALSDMPGVQICFQSSVNVATGNLHHSQTLFEVPNSKLMNSFELAYNSLDSRTAPLGRGWTHTYNISVAPNNNGTYTVTEGDGSKAAYYSSGDHYTPRNASFPILTVNADGTYTIEHKDGITYELNQLGKIDTIKDRNDNTLTFTYNAGNLTSITDPSGRAASLAYGSNGRITSITDTNGNIHSITYTGPDLTGLSSQILNLGTRGWTYTYDSNGFMLSKTDPESFETHYSYDSNHRVTDGTDPQGRTRSISYNPGVQQTQLTEKDGGIWTFAYNSSTGTLTQKTDPLGHSIYYTYDTNRNLTSTTDQRENATTYDYDSAGNITSVTDALNHVTTYTYNSLNKPLTITETGTSGYPTTMTYDSTGNLTSVTDPLLNTTIYGYDTRGNLTSIEDAQHHVTTLDYDTNNYLRAITEPTGAVTSFDYDAAGNMTQMTDPYSKRTVYTYNGLNQITSITDPENHTTHFHNDLKGNVDYVTDANDNITYYTYTYDDQVETVTDANGYTTTYVYGGTGCPACGGGVDKLTSLTDAKNNTTNFEYTLTGKLNKLTNPTGSYKTYTYDWAGNLHTMTDENGNTTTYENDELNRVTTVTFPDTTTKTFGYDALGNLISASNQNIQYTIGYDDNGNPLNVTDSQGKAVSYLYDTLNRRQQLTTPDSRVITYGYDDINRFTTIQAGSDTFMLGYDLLKRRISLSHPNGVSTGYGYSDASNLNGINIVDPQQNVINSFAHTFDNVGNKKTLTDLSGLHNFDYDFTYQLTQATHPSPQPTEQYFYDHVGNRMGTTVDDDNKLLEDSLYIYGYDTNGNRTSRTEKATNVVTTYGYDYENRLISVSGPGMTISYKYDAFGRRIEKSVNGVVTKYVYDGPNIVTEYDGSGNVTAAYVHNLAIDDPLSVTQTGLTYFYHKDSMGSVTDITNFTGATVQAYDYDSYGNIIGMSGSITQPFTFTGREYDPETGLYYYRARYYDAQAGRFITRDPIGFEAGDTNIYRYVGNSSLNRVDPWGLKWTDWQESILATIEGTTEESTKLTKKTAYGLDTNTDIFVALPDENLIGEQIEIEVNGQTIVATVGDVGPWNGGHSRKGTDFNDPYWDDNQRPQAECGKDKRGRKTNKAGVDISAALAEKLGLKGNVYLRWRGLP